MSFSKKFSEKNPFNQSPIKQQKEELGLWDQFKANIAENLDPYNYASQEQRVKEAAHDGNEQRLVEDTTGTTDKIISDYDKGVYDKYKEATETAADVKDVIGRVLSAGLGNPEKENIYQQATKVNRETGEAHTYKERNEQSVHERKDLMSILMGTPQQFNSIEKSQYQPSNSTDPNAVYYKSKATEDTLKQQYNKILNHFNETGKDKLTTYNAGLKGEFAEQHNVLGRYTVSKGIDEDGREYISYYDKWDLQPFKESGFLTSITDKLQDVAGLNPPEVYGRIYKDEIGEETWQDKMENRNNKE
jgi:hypothetical protein